MKEMTSKQQSIRTIIGKIVEIEKNESIENKWIEIEPLLKVIDYIVEGDK